MKVRNSKIVAKLKNKTKNTKLIKEIEKVIERKQDADMHGLAVLGLVAVIFITLFVKAVFY